jgi:CRP-like cAMP-binding protein
MRGEVELSSAGRTIRVIKEGDLFGEFSFMMSEPSGYTATARTLVHTASLSKARIADVLRKHPSFHNQISSVMSRHKDVMTARATTIVQSDFKGTFDTMPFANVLQVLSIGRKTGVLGIRQEELSGGIYLDNGEAIHAWTDDSEGEEAFYALSGWVEGKFAFNSMRREERRTLTKATITLLMEAMRRIEENGPPAAASEDAGLESLFPPQ